MLKKNLYILIFFFAHYSFCMEQDACNYSLTVQKLVSMQDAFKVEIGKSLTGINSTRSNQTCSFVANFADHTISQQQNMFAPFQLAATKFDSSAQSDCLLWNIPNFGLLKVAKEGSVVFGHEADEAPLAQHAVSFQTSGPLFLQLLKVAQLTLKSPETRLCGAVVANRLLADRMVHNEGGLKTRHISGSGQLLNTALLELEGSKESPAVLAIKEFQNKTNKRAALAAKISGSYVQVAQGNRLFKNSENAQVDLTGTMDVAAPSLNNSALVNKGDFKSNHICLRRRSCNEGSWQVHTMTGFKPFTNKEFGNLKTRSVILASSLVNEGDCEMGNLAGGSCSVLNKGSLVCRQGHIALAGAQLGNTGRWVMDKMTGSPPVTMTNDGTLTLKDSTLSFDTLQNNSDLVLQSGAYQVKQLNSKRLTLENNNWTVTDDPSNNAPHRLVVTDPSPSIGHIEAQKDLSYHAAHAPTFLHAQGDINCSDRYVYPLDFLKVLKTSGQVTAWTGPVSIVKPEGELHCMYLFKDLDFSHIGHLNLFVDGPFTTHYAFKAPTLSLHVMGPLTLGKSNEQLGTLAATEGPLHVDAHSIDAQFGKLYGKGKTHIQSTQEDITVGAPIRGVDEDIKQHYISVVNPKIFLPRFDYLVNQRNGAYATSDNHLTLRSAAHIFVKYGAIISALGNHLIAQREIENRAGSISSHGPIEIEAELYNHTRDAVRSYRYKWSNDFPGSGPAILESLQSINFLVKKVINRASSIRSGEDITINASHPLSQANGYFEEPQQLFRRWGYPSDPQLLFSLSSVTQAGENISMNLGNFAISGNMSAGTIAVRANTGTWSTTNRTRQTVNTSQPRIVDVTHYMQEQARKPGIYRLGADRRVQTEFPLGAASKPQEGHRVLLENSDCQTPLNWRALFNPLSSINLDTHLQQLLGNLAGKVYAGNAKGNGLATMLWANAHKWRRENGKDVMSAEDLSTVNKTMLLTSILCNGATQQQQTLLCIAPQDINPFQSPGDTCAQSVSSITTGDQTMANNRIVATGSGGIEVKSTRDAVNLQTEKYTVDAITSIEERAMPQQQLVATEGSVSVSGQQNVTRTGTTIAAAQNIDEHSQAGSVTRNPLTLQKTTFKTHRKRRGLFSHKTRTETNLTNSAVTAVTNASVNLHAQAGTAIQSVASQDSAGQEIVYNAPRTTIEGALLANKTTSSTHTRGAFTQQTSTQSKEHPRAVPATIQAPVVRFQGQEAHVNATVVAQELHDETEFGIQFVPKIAQMLCSGQTLIKSPLLSADVGYRAMYETMIPPMLMVEKIIRTKDTGHMVFDSVVMDKDRTEVIGKFVETTYQLKHWQTSWHRTHQVIPNEALVVIALAITLATQGMGVELMGPMLQSITATTGMELSAAGVAAVNAGFSTICSSIGTSILRTGDVVGAMKQLTSPAQLKSLTCTMASAGLCAQLGDMLDINMKPGAKPFAEHVQEQTVRTTVDALLNVAINNASADAVLGDLTHIPVRAVAAYASSKISASCLDSVSQKTAQAAVGGLSGVAMKHSFKGFSSGATGALTAELVGDYLISDAQAIAEAAIAKLQTKKIPLTEETIQQAIAHEVQEKTKMAKVAAGAAAVATGQNVSVAIATGTNAVDNDVAVRGTLYALSEFQSMVQAASQAVATLQLHQQEEQEATDTAARETTSSAQAAAATQDDSESPSLSTCPRCQTTEQSSPEEHKNDVVHALFLQALEQPEKYDALVLQYAQELFNQDEPQQLVRNRIDNTDTSGFIQEAGEFIKIAFVDAVNKTIDTFSIVPNPIGAACFAAETGRDLYQGKSTVAEIAVNTALAFGVLKGVKFAGRGIKIIYQKGKGIVKDITDKVATRHQNKFAAARKVPFVENPEAGTWHSSEATISNDLILNDFKSYLRARLQTPKNPAAPFNVVGHGSSSSIAVNIHATDLHPKSLSQENFFLLRKMGKVSLNAIQLARVIRTAPGYTKGQHINLLACECGKNPHGIAQQLATRMDVPVSAFTGRIFTASDGAKFGTLITVDGKRKYGVMKTFYPNEGGHKYRLLPLAALSAFLLSGDNGQFHETDSTDDEWLGQYYKWFDSPSTIEEDRLY